MSLLAQALRLQAFRVASASSTAGLVSASGSGHAAVDEMGVDKRWRWRVALPHFHVTADELVGGAAPGELLELPGLASEGFIITMKVGAIAEIYQIGPGSKGPLGGGGL